LVIRYNEEKKKTEFEYLNDIVDVLEPINHARQIILDEVAKEPGQIKSKLIKRVMNDEVSQIAARNAIDGLLAEKRLKEFTIGNRKLLYPHTTEYTDAEQVKFEHLDIEDIKFDK
jgi:hypothetical protein